MCNHLTSDQGSLMFSNRPRTILNISNRAHNNTGRTGRNTGRNPNRGKWKSGGCRRGKKGHPRICILKNVEYHICSQWLTHRVEIIHYVVNICRVADSCHQTTTGLGQIILGKSATENKLHGYICIFNFIHWVAKWNFMYLLHLPHCSTLITSSRDTMACGVHPK